MRVEIGEGECQGHGRCVDLAPDVFEYDELGYGVVGLPDGIPDHLVSVVDVAILNCPARAIRWIPDSDEQTPAASVQGPQEQGDVHGQV